MANNRSQSTGSEFALEKLRTTFAEHLTQDEFVITCGLKRATYFRWQSGQTEVKLSPGQVEKICSVCGIDANTLFHFLVDGKDSSDAQPSEKEVRSP